MWPFSLSVEVDPRLQKGEGWWSVVRQPAIWELGGGVSFFLHKVWKAHYKYHFCKALETLFLTPQTTLLLVPTQYLALSYICLLVCGVESKLCHPHYPDQKFLYLLWLNLNFFFTLSCALQTTGTQLSGKCNLQVWPPQSTLTYLKSPNCSNSCSIMWWTCSTSSPMP